jgi:hypothetical protein
VVRVGEEVDGDGLHGAKRQSSRVLRHRATKTTIDISILNSYCE